MSSKALLYVEVDCPPELEEEFHTWYNCEHVPERLGIEGFLQARRYAALVGAPRWLATYELESPAVFQSPEYASHYGDFQTPWTKRVTSITQVYRRTYEVTWVSSPVADSGGRPLDGGLLAVRYGAADDDLSRVDGWLESEGAPSLLRLPGVLSARRLRCIDPSREAESLALYELESPWVAQDPEFIQAWTAGWRANRSALSLFNQILYACILDGK